MGYKPSKGEKPKNSDDYLVEQKTSSRTFPDAMLISYSKKIFTVK